MLDFVVSCWHCCPPAYCPASYSIQRQTCKSLCQSIFLLYCLSCWVSMSHVKALAVKTSVDEVSADTVPLLNQWPLKVWEQASLSHWAQACSDPRVTDVLSSLLWVWWQSFAEAHLHTWLRCKADSSHMPLLYHHTNRNKQTNLAMIPLNLVHFFFLEEYFIGKPGSR